jgi:hypothetical protein
LNSRIASIDVSGTVAAVRLELDNRTGHRFTELFTPMKSDRQWRITNKDFPRHS